MTDRKRPNDHGVENENMKDGGNGRAPRPSTEPAGSAGTSKSSKTKTDAATGRS